jgi:serine phosphatase RsbU (regulator of sigma subunit)
MDQTPGASRFLLTPIDENAVHTILVVERDEALRASLTETLHLTEHEVIAVEDGAQALQTLTRAGVSLVLCGHDLPAISGPHLCRRVKEDPTFGQPYVILFASGERSDEIRIAEDAGADEILPAGCAMREVLVQVKSGLRIVTLQRGLSLRNEEFQRLSLRLNHELEVVSNIQKALLPQAIPQTPAFDFTSFYLPSTECGGDYYDLIQLDKGRQGFVIADVSGHGAPAMVTMAMIRQNFHLIANKFAEPNLLLEELNRLLFDHLPTDQYVTMLYAIVNTKTLECTYSSAGHNPPFWFRAAEDKVSLLKGCEGFPLKLVTRDATYANTTIELKAGDRLIFYTDGIAECFSPKREIYGMDRFESVIVRNAHEPKVRKLENAIVTDVLDFADGHPAEDDFTLAIMGVH